MPVARRGLAGLAWAMAGAVVAATPSGGRGSSDHGLIQYCIVGAGPGGVQLAAQLGAAGRSHVVFERAAGAGSFFGRFPRHRRLISINKVHTGSRNTEFNLRHDWNSLLAPLDEGGAHGGRGDFPRFPSFDLAYWPHAANLERYIARFAEAASVNVRYNTTVIRIAPIREEGGPGFVVTTVPTGVSSSSSTDGGGGIAAAEQEHTCEWVVVATGARELVRFDSVDPDGVIEYYDEVPVSAEGYADQEVVIFGKGNAALEVADKIYPAAARVQLVSRGRAKLAWATHYVGHARARGVQTLESYQLKSLDTAGITGDITRMRFQRDSRTGLVRIYRNEADEDDDDDGDDDGDGDGGGDSLAANGASARGRGRKRGGGGSDRDAWVEDTDLGPAHRVIACTGWCAGLDSMFAPGAGPAMQTDRFPLLTAGYESVNVKGLFFAGALMHARDVPRSSGGFVHGFRYLVRALGRLLESRHHGAAWPSVEIPLGRTAAAVRSLLCRVNEMSGPYQMFGVLVDVIILPHWTDAERGQDRGVSDGNHADADSSDGGGGRRTEVRLPEVPADAVADVVRREAPNGTVRYITVSFEYGRGFSSLSADPFDPANVNPPDFDNPRGPGARSNFLHPVFRLHELASGRGGRLAEAASVDVLRRAVLDLAPLAAPVADGRVAAAATAPELLALADQAGVGHHELEQAACPPDWSVGRSVCFENDVVSEHHLVEVTRIEFWEEEMHVQPLAKWLAGHVAGLRPLGKDGAARVSRAVKENHASTRRAVAASRERGGAGADGAEGRPQTSVHDAAGRDEGEL